MQSITIDTGTIRLLINDDPARVLTFNPADVTFAERFYALIQDFEQALAKYQRRAKELDAVSEVDQYGIPVNARERIAFLRETCEFYREKIDALFGAGTSQMVFGDELVIEAFEQFFEVITPFVQQKREEKLAQYINKKQAGRVMKA